MFLISGISLETSHNSSSSSHELSSNFTHNLEDPHSHFHELFFTICFVATLWIAGHMMQRLCKMPCLVGEIIAGIVLGPEGCNLVPNTSMLTLLGDIGLMLLVVEAGLDVDMETMKIIGPRGVVVATLGSIFPITIGYFIAANVFGKEVKSALAIASCFGPTSMGIALKVLRSGRELNTPTGQLVIAAAVLDDIYALILLSELAILDSPDPSIIDFLKPAIVSVSLVVGMGYFAIRIMPRVLRQYILPRFGHGSHERVSLGV
jgi:Kef-type K+ transport system membrane component KefB